MGTKFNPVPWVLCECPDCGHQQEAHPSVVERYVIRCDHCGHQTEPKGTEPPANT